MVETRRPWSAEDKSAFARTLKASFGARAVHEGEFCIQVDSDFGRVDVVPQSGDFVPNASGRNAMPTDRFHANPKGQQAVRLVKVQAEERGRAWKGDRIERLVLGAQKEHPAWTNRELANAVCSRLGSSQRATRDIEAESSRTSTRC
mmetsp:Transcript_16516/g.47010  ORF Transcript_16516/g.47010 Transcript_16516/m.47010 type:complete len:147 (-) Transcript_16516:80-520(-)